MLLQHLSTHFSKKLPFVAYRKPNKTTVSAFFQESDELLFIDDYQESGFVFAPFDNTQRAIIIPKTGSMFFKEDMSFEKSYSDGMLITLKDEEKQKHIKLIQKGICAIKNKELEKVVLSRLETLVISDVDLLTIFQRLLAKYPTAFVYIWFHPKVGLWLGATPETLLKVKGYEFETMSLAGTQIFNDTIDVGWQPKEIQEQQLVTDYIVERLKPISDTLYIDALKTVKAGNLLHLQTTISGTMQPLQLGTLLRVLHPTPAVCGLPKQVAKQFILKNESYNREFYTGFLGELNFSDTEPNGQNTTLFVNLRCMQIKNKQVSIYVGGGITEDSDAVKEWEETVAKAQVIFQVLNS